VKRGLLLACCIVSSTTHLLMMLMHLLMMLLLLMKLPLCIPVSTLVMLAVKTVKVRAKVELRHVEALKCTVETERRTPREVSASFECRTLWFTSSAPEEERVIVIVGEEVMSAEDVVEVFGASRAAIKRAFAESIVLLAFLLIT